MVYCLIMLLAQSAFAFRLCVYYYYYYYYYYYCCCCTDYPLLVLYTNVLVPGSCRTLISELAFCRHVCNFHLKYL